MLVRLRWRTDYGTDTAQPAHAPLDAPLLRRVRRSVAARPVPDTGLYRGGPVVRRAGSGVPVITMATARLRNRQIELWTAAHSLSDQVATENRMFTAAEDAEWAEVIAELEYIGERLRGALAAEQERARA